VQGDDDAALDRGASIDDDDDPFTSLLASSLADFSARAARAASTPLDAPPATRRLSPPSADATTIIIFNRPRREFFLNSAPKSNATSSPATRAPPALKNVARDALVDCVPNPSRTLSTNVANVSLSAHSNASVFPSCFTSTFVVIDPERDARRAKTDERFAALWGQATHSRARRHGCRRELAQRGGRRDHRENAGGVRAAVGRTSIGARDETRMILMIR